MSEDMYVCLECGETDILTYGNESYPLRCPNCGRRTGTKSVNEVDTDDFLDAIRNKSEEIEKLKSKLKKVKSK